MGVTFPELVPRHVFIRGDTNGDGLMDISDAVRILLGLFVDGRYLPCLDAADYDDNGVDLSDALKVLGFIFRWPPPAPAVPFPGWGADWFDDDALDCNWEPRG
jgi:hypothetical protein